MSYHDSFSLKVTIKDVGYAKRNKRCKPKEGMPHARKACQKKRKKRKMHTQRKYATRPQGMSKEKKRKEKRKIVHIHGK